MSTFLLQSPVIDEFDVDFAIELFKTQEVIALDTESTGNDVRDGRGYGIGISIGTRYRDNNVYTYFPIRHSYGSNVDPTDFQRLKTAIEEYDGWLIFHNAKFDLVSLETMGIKYKGKFFDTMLMCHLINENLPYEKSLNACVQKYVGKEVSKKNDEKFQLAVKLYGWDMPVDFMIQYAAWDAMITYFLWANIIEKFREEVPAEYWQHKQDFIRVIIEMERLGVRIDQDKARRMVTIGESNMQDIVDELGLNPGSNKDLEELLIQRLKLPVVKRSPKTQKPSFDKHAMETYEEILERRQDETAQQILTYRGWQKTVSSNYRAYLELVSPDGRLRPNYKLHGTKTGRLSCEKPNLQQIPKSSAKEWNGDLKETFIPDDGYVIVEFDYSQLELRLATAYCREQALAEIFEAGRDIFTEMSQGLGMTRQDTKTLVYSIQYGGGVNRLCNVFGVSPGKAAEIRENFYNTYRGFRRVSNAASNRCKVEGKVKLWTGRYRHFRFRHDEAHKAFNSIMQGGAADIVETTMVRLHKEVVCNDARMLLQVHDSVWFEIKKERLDEFIEKIQTVMTDIQDGAFGVTFAVDYKQIGKAA